MSLVWLICCGCLVVFTAFAGVLYLDAGSDTVAAWCMILCGCAALGVLGFGIGGLVTSGSRAVGRTTCRHWGERTNFKTQFVILNWNDTGTCLALAPNGQWVKNTKVAQFLQGRP